MVDAQSCDSYVPLALLVLTLIGIKFFTNLLKLKQRKETNMEHKRNVKINWKTGLTSLVETFWAIGTSIAAAGVLQTHRQAHCLVAQADTRPKPAKELALPTFGLIIINKARNANTVYTKWAR